MQLWIKDNQSITSECNSHRNMTLLSKEAREEQERSKNDTSAVTGSVPREGDAVEKRKQLMTQSMQTPSLRHEQAPPARAHNWTTCSSEITHQ